MMVVVLRWERWILLWFGDFVWFGLRKKLGFGLVVFFFSLLWTGGGGCCCGCDCG